jgi:isopentenyl diphosphate isomerase/L-lactate dehydrogenase-like FMN-dependent dehydrogenase
VLQLLKAELETAMLLMGCRTLADVHPGLVTHSREYYSLERARL